MVEVLRDLDFHVTLTVEFKVTRLLLVVGRVESGFRGCV